MSVQINNDDNRVIVTVRHSISILPLDWHTPGTKSHAVDEFSQCVSWQWLGECVGHVLCSWNIMKDHAAHLGVLFDKVMSYINVFGSAMILVIQTVSY